MIRIFCILIATGFSAQAALARDFYVLQAGKTFLDPAQESKAAQLNDNPDETRALALKTLTIHRGDSVIFRNRDVVAHNVASVSFDLKVQETGTDTVPQKFDQVGEFPVNCMIHPKMKLNIIVTKD